ERTCSFIKPPISDQCRLRPGKRTRHHLTDLGGGSRGLPNACLINSSSKKVRASGRANEMRVGGKTDIARLIGRRRQSSIDIDFFGDAIVSRRDMVPTAIHPISRRNWHPKFLVPCRPQSKGQKSSMSL